MSKILIVDDDRKVVRMLTRRLTKAGHQIFTAKNGQVGMKKASNLTPDLILMDIHMPVINGYEAVRLLRKQGYKGLISALTASVMVGDKPQSIEAGCDYYIAKPIDAGFEATIEEILRGRKRTQ